MILNPNGEAIERNRGIINKKVIDMISLQ